MVSIEQFYNFTSSKGILRADKYILHTKRNKERTRYILGLNKVDGGKEYYYNKPNVSEALIDAVEISNRFPNGEYLDWDDDEKDKADKAALSFYNKYGHLGIYNYLEYVLEHSINVHYGIDYVSAKDYFLPLSKRKKASLQETKEGIFEGIKTNRQNNFNQILLISKDLFYNEHLDMSEKEDLTRSLNTLNEQAEKFNNLISFDYEKPVESIGEPVYMFYDLIWFLSRCMETWDRYLREKPSLYLRYTPSKRDSLERLSNDFECRATIVHKDKDGLYYDEYGYLPKNIDPIDGKYGRGKNYWTTWKDLLDFYSQKFVINTEIEFENNEPVMKYDVNSLFLLMHFSYMADVEKKLRRNYRMCKNPNCLNFVYPTGNRVKLYCSKECASAHNSYKTRRRKAGLEVET